MRPPRGELDDPFRAPDRLAHILPLIAAFGLMLVICAAAAGRSASVVALTAGAGFALCALAPAMLMELYVGRPLRALLALLRAARDGLEAPIAPAPAGVIADLVAVARDVGARKGGADRIAGALEQWERAAANNDAAMRALRQQWETMAATASAASPEIAAALHALKADADDATARLDQTLTHLAEAGRDGQERLERRLADIAQGVEREAQSLREGVASAARMLHDDIASTISEDRAAESRQSSRWEALESKILGRLATPETGRLAETIRSEAEATRAVLLARSAEESEVKALSTLKNTTEKLRNAIDRLDALSASAANHASMQSDDLRAALKALQEQTADLSGRIEGAANTDAVLTRLEAGAASWETRASELTLAASVEAQTLAALRSDIATVKARVAEVAPRAAAAAENLADRLLAKLDTFDATALQAAARDLAEAQARSERHASEIAAAAAALAALARRDSREFGASRDSDSYTESLPDSKRRLAASH